MGLKKPTDRARGACNAEAHDGKWTALPAPGGD
jgi:hypothetical protein